MAEEGRLERKARDESLAMIASQDIGDESIRVVVGHRHRDRCAAPTPPDQRRTAFVRQVWNIDIVVPARQFGPAHDGRMSFCPRRPDFDQDPTVPAHDLALLSRTNFDRKGDVGLAADVPPGLERHVDDMEVGVSRFEPPSCATDHAAEQTGGGLVDGDAELDDRPDVMRPDVAQAVRSPRHHGSQTLVERMPGRRRPQSVRTANEQGFVPFDLEVADREADGRLRNGRGLGPRR